MELLEYILKVNLCWVLFYFTYRVFLHKYTFFRLNRAFLLLALLTSFIFPLITLPAETATAEVTAVVLPATPVAHTIATAATAPVQTPANPIMIVLIAGVCFMILRFGRQLLQLRKVVQSGESLLFDDHTLVLLDHNEIGSFSFLKWIVVNRNDYEFNLDTVLRHESVHIRQRHTLDVLLVELLRIVCWFNPVLWLYKSSLQELHEFLADEDMPEREHYATFLVSYGRNKPLQALTNHFFNTSLLKSRIMMLYQKRSAKKLLRSYLLLLPVIAMLLITVAAREHAPIELTDIRGTIRDENGKAISGADIVVRDETRGTSTNLQGKFAFPRVPVGTRLVVSHVSFQSSQFLVAAGKPEYNIRLKRVKNKLSKVVVTGDETSVIGLPEAGPPAESKKDSFIVVEQVAEFPGGNEALAKYLGANMRYPNEAQKAKIQGKALVSFIVNDNGDVRDPRVVKGLGYGIDEEAIRVVLNMPRWKPAKQNGQAMATEYHLPLEFKLESPKPAVKSGK